MRLGDYTFEYDPDDMTPPKRVKAAASQRTYSSAVFFEWPAFLAGLTLELFWDSMPSAQFDNLNAKFQAGGSYEFNPDIGSGVISYNVEILSFTGVYEKVILDDFDYRRNVQMELMISSQASTTTTSSTTSTTTSTTS